MSNCTLLLGEDKWLDLKAAMDDLKTKRKDQPLSHMHYGDVPFLLGYAAAGSKFQWLWLSADGCQASFYSPCLIVYICAIVHKLDVILQYIFSMDGGVSKNTFLGHAS